MSGKMNKRGVAIETLFYLLAAILLLVVMVVGYFYLTGNGSSSIGFLKNFFMFGS
jgi:hypothetical protein